LSGEEEVRVTATPVALSPSGTREWDDACVYTLGTTVTFCPWKHIGMGSG
jgi:hypothetical protein